jgi:hypothetical protein
MDLHALSVRQGYGSVRHPASDAEWRALITEFGGQLAAPLASVLGTVRGLRCRTVVIENRYIDADYRSDYSTFWSTAFAGRPEFAIRLHFFARVIRDDQLHRLPSNSSYLGYTVIRPVPFGAVGRTMIAPPRRLARRAQGSDGRLILAEETVHLFGNDLTVHAAPFMQQDGQFLRCAHVAAWVCHYAAARRGLVQRQLTSSFVLSAPSILQPDRALPSSGMTLDQLQAVFNGFGQPAILYQIGDLPSIPGVADPTDPTRDTRLFGVLCRYVNSGFPVLVTTKTHAFIVVGWYRDGKRLRFIVNDDQVGPYWVVSSPFTDFRSPWTYIMIPMPPKAYLSAEGAEIAARKMLRSIANIQNIPPALQELGRRVQTAEVSFRTVLCNGSDYKRAADERGLTDDVVRLIRLSQLAHYVWVVEVHDRRSREDGRPSVLAELVYDSTSYDRQPSLHILALLGAWSAYAADGRPPAGASSSSTPWGSLLRSSALADGGSLLTNARTPAAQ